MGLSKSLRRPLAISPTHLAAWRARTRNQPLTASRLSAVEGGYGMMWYVMR